MLRGLFPRLFGQYREGGLIVGKFLVSNSGATLTPVDGESYVGLTAAGSLGQYVVTLRDGARNITVVGQPYATLPDEDDPTDARHVFVNDEDGINEGSGTIPLTVMDVETASPVVSALVDGSVLVVILYVNK